MSRDPRYQKLLNAKEWQQVRRIVWQRANGLCERCKAEGKITPGVDCHHRIPVESAKTLEEMRRLAYSIDNVQLLCIACHVKTHEEARSHTTESLKASRQRRQARWVEQMQQRFVKHNDVGREPPDG